MNPKYPVFVPTKGRWEGMHTIRALWRCRIPFRIVIERQDYDSYRRALDAHGIEPLEILVVPHQDEGLVVTRNWIWDFARDMGAERFWTFDDNIRGLFRFNRNLLVPVRDGSTLAVIESFVERYTNVPIVGMNYFMFVSRKCLIPPYYMNTRVYSNMLIWTDYRDPRGRPYRNEGFYNDDTDLCLRVLKDGNCTFLFNAFLIDKITTMYVKGGMTPHYQGDGRWKMAEELRQKHPDVTTITRKWGRWQHQVDYGPFKRNRPIFRDDIEIPEGVDEFGMVLEVNGEVVPKEVGLSREFLAAEADAKAAARKRRARERGKRIRKQRATKRATPAPQQEPAEDGRSDRDDALARFREGHERMKRMRAEAERTREIELRRRERIGDRP